MLSLIIDTETSGLNPNEDRIVEMAFILTDWKSIYGAVRSYVNPGISFDNSENGLNTKSVAQAPSFQELLPFTYMLLLYADEYIAHNWPFDRNFIRNELSYCNMALPNRMVFDTMRSAGGRRSLKDACEYYRISVSDINWHSALDDAVATLRLARAIRGDKPGDPGATPPSVSLIPRL